jgi:hypothetical protein
MTLQLARKNITTIEFAHLVGVQPATIRRGLCENGHYMGIKPQKLPNRMLLWPLAEIEKVTSGEQV